MEPLKGKKCDCGADILFVIMAMTGKKMPVDAKKILVLICDEKNKGTILNAYIPHWGTCPIVKKFKKEKKGGDSK